MSDKKKTSMTHRDTIVPPRGKENKKKTKNNITPFPGNKKPKTKKKSDIKAEEKKAETKTAGAKKDTKTRAPKQDSAFVKNTKRAAKIAGEAITTIEDAIDGEPVSKTSRAREKREKRRKLRRRVILIVFLSIIALFLLGYFLCTIKQVQVEGNKLYEDQVISEMVLSDNNSWNALYVVFANKFLPKEKMPFIDDVEIKLTGRNSIRIEVYEKPTIGCIYVDGSGQYAYFDKDGIVCELSSDVLKTVPQIYGISCFDAELYDDIELSDPSILKTLLLLVVDLDKYGIPSDSITFQGSHINLQYDHITVNLGTSQYLTEKLMRLTKVLPQLDALAGTLHLDTWNPENTDIVFKKQK